MAPSHHGRSLSLPSASHPAISQFDENLSRLRSSEASSSSLSSIRNLYESIDDLLLLPHVQQIISEESVDGCIRLLDACSTVKDLISLVKQDLRELLSSVRRKDAQGINGFSLLESLLANMLGTSVQERKNGWSLVSKLMQSKKVSDEENEFNKVDLFLQKSQENKLVNHLKKMDSSIEVVEEELENIFRQLIKTRVSLLNILNH